MLTPCCRKPKLKKLKKISELNFDSVPASQARDPIDSKALC